jgi:hypothetical protein
MIRTIGFILVSVLFFELKSISHENPITQFTISDTINIEVNAYRDSLGILDKYSAYVFTPVCEEDKCYAIEIIFYWDLIGRFQHYDTIPGKGLTKLDHIPFTESDYTKLDYIISNPNSILSAYTKEELVKNTRSSDIDGFTGATVHEIKESVISGAVYSCHTLWHIAHRSAVYNLQEVTKSEFNPDLVKKLAHQNDQEIDYFLINNFSDHDFIKYLPEVLQTIQRGKGYYAKQAIEKIPAGVVADSLAQDFFSAHFDRLDYFAQVALLEKFDNKSLGEKLKGTFIKSLDDRNSYRNELIMKLVDYQ